VTYIWLVVGFCSPIGLHSLRRTETKVGPDLQIPSISFVSVLAFSHTSKPPSIRFRRSGGLGYRQAVGSFHGPRHRPGHPLSKELCARNGTTFTSIPFDSLVHFPTIKALRKEGCEIGNTPGLPCLQSKQSSLLFLTSCHLSPSLLSSFPLKTPYPGKLLKSKCHKVSWGVLFPHRFAVF
jgi:hypothetical protein